MIVKINFNGKIPIKKFQIPMRYAIGIWNLEFDLTLRRRTAVRLYDVPWGNKKKSNKKIPNSNYYWVGIWNFQNWNLINNL